jgi:hypothetical protein
MKQTMDVPLEAHGREYRFVRQEGVEFAPVQPEVDAYQSRQQLETILGDLGFTRVEPAVENKWEPVDYLRIENEQGRHLRLRVGYSGPDSEEIRKQQSVVYDIEGLLDSVNYANAQIKESRDHPDEEDDSGPLTCGHRKSTEIKK